MLILCRCKMNDTIKFKIKQKKTRTAVSLLLLIVPTGLIIFTDKINVWGLLACYAGSVAIWTMNVNDMIRKFLEYRFKKKGGR